MAATILDKIREVDNPFEAQDTERKKLIGSLEKLTNRYVAVLYQSLTSRYSILDDSDAEMLEAILSANPPRKALLLIINSNGGLPLAAERLVHVAREYAPRGFETMVVQKAKSAATMVCLGSDRIFMTPTAELGPIDPQIFGFDRSRRISVDSYLEAYDKLMGKMERLDMNKSNPTGLLHQLERFDAAHVEEMRKARDLGRDMTTKFLSTYMLRNASKRKIDSVVRKFSESAAHKSHGRPIWAKEARSSGLKIATMRQNTAIWKASYELLLRYDHLCHLHEMVRGEETLKMLETTATAHRSGMPITEEDSE